VEEFFRQFVHYLKIERLGQLKKHLGLERRPTKWRNLFKGIDAKNGAGDQRGICRGYGKAS